LGLEGVGLGFLEDVAVEAGVEEEEGVLAVEEDSLRSRFLPPGSLLLALGVDPDPEGGGGEAITAADAVEVEVEVEVGFLFLRKGPGKEDLPAAVAAAAIG